MSEVIYPVIGLSLATILIAYKRGWIKAMVERYQQIDSKNITIESLLFIASPFLATAIFNFFNQSSAVNPDLTVNITETNNPLMKIPFQALGTGVGIVAANFLINQVKYENTIKDLKKVCLMCIKEQLKALAVIIQKLQKIEQDIENHIDLQDFNSLIDIIKDEKISLDKLVNSLQANKIYEKVVGEQRLFNFDIFEHTQIYFTSYLECLFNIENFSDYSLRKIADGNEILKQDNTDPKKVCEEAARRIKEDIIPFIVVTSAKGNKCQTKLLKQSNEKEKATNELKGLISKIKEDRQSNIKVYQDTDLNYLEDF